MPLLPNDHHPSPRCSCRECLSAYADPAGFHGDLAQQGRTPGHTERLSSGDAIACISMALQNPPDMQEWTRLLRDCRYVIEKLEDELAEAKRRRPDDRSNV